MADATSLAVKFVCRSFLEETVVQTFESLTVTSFVFCHFVNGVVDGVEIQFLGTTCYAHLVGICACFGCHALFEVGLGIPYAFAKQFSEFCSMFSFFPSVALEGFGDFGIAFAVGLTRHCEIHAYFAAFAVEVCGKVGYHFGIGAFGNAYFVLGYEIEGFSFVEFFELALGSAADRAFFGSFVTFVYVTANGADKFL